MKSMSWKRKGKKRKRKESGWDQKLVIEEGIHPVAQQICQDKCHPQSVVPKHRHPGMAGLHSFGGRRCSVYCG